MTLFPLMLALLGAPPALLDAAERAPAMTYVVTPFGLAGSVGSSDVLGETERVASELTSLQILSPEQAGAPPRAMSECPAEVRLTCWLEQTRAQLGEDAVLVVATIEPLEKGRDRVSLMILDAQSLREAERAARNDRGDERLGAEDWLFSHATRSSPFEVNRDVPTSLNEGVHRAFRTSFRPFLESRGAWRAPGEILLETNCSDCGLTLDERSLGSVGGTQNLLTNVRPGKRRLGLMRRGESLTRSEVLVSQGTRSELRLLVELPSERVDPTGAILTWSGAAVLTAGVVVLSYGIHQSIDNNRLCLEPDGTPCDSRSLDTAVPVGVALMGPGAGALGAGLFAEPEHRWIWVLGGVVLGAAAATASWAAVQ